MVINTLSVDIYYIKIKVGYDILLYVELRHIFFEQYFYFIIVYNNRALIQIFVLDAI